MTEAEAIKELERHIQFLRENWKPHPDYNVIEALGMAINALEKQIAKKPIFKTWSPVKCPTCGCDLNKSIGDGYYQRCIPMKFCECGQCLNWEEV